MTTQERVMSLFESANPVPEPGNSTPQTASDYLATLDRRTNTMTLTAIEPEAPEHNNSKRPWLMAAAGVAALALVGGLVAFGTRADDDQLPADQPPQSVPTEAATTIAPEPEPEPATPVAPEPEPEPETTVAAEPIVPFVTNGISDIAVAAEGGLMVVDASAGRVVRVDPATTERTIISANADEGLAGELGNVVGSGPSFSSPSGIAVEAAGNLLVIDVDLAAVVRIDPVTGDRTIISDADTGNGPGFGTLLGGIAIEADGNVVVTDGAQTVVRVDPVTGDRTIISDADTGNGPAFAAPLGNVPLERSIVVEANGDLLVLDAGLAAIVRVDPANGDRSIVSDADTGSGPALGAGSSLDMAIEADGNIVVTVQESAAWAVLRVNPVTGDRSIVSDADTGDGIRLFWPYGIAVEADGNLIVTDTGLAAVIRVDPVTGDRAQN
jgi:streptogramin lyase